MNLYRISQTETDDWDTYDSAVVAAENMSDAANIHPDGGNDDRSEPDIWGEVINYHSWVSPDKVKVELIGVAAPGTVAGVIVASFNAG